MTMYPAYGWADSFPHQRNPMVYAPRENPRAEAIPLHMMMNATTPNLPYQSWPHSGSSCYPVPLDCHGCCNHSYFGGPYSFRPPYSHYPPPPSCYIHGGYPPYLGAYPAYSIPPPHYSMEHPQYESDKSASRDHHCCRCPHHLSKQEGDKDVKIELQEPENDEKTKNYPYPIVWIPPGYMKNIESEGKEIDKHFHNTEHNERLKPFEMKYFDPLKQSGNDKGTQHQQIEDGNHLPFPIFWLPYKNNEAENDSKENNSRQVTSSVTPSSGSDDKRIQLMANEQNSSDEVDSRLSGKHAVHKVIPVKQIESQGENHPKSVEKKAKSSVVEHAGNSGEGQHSGNTGTRQPTSPKASKLPPVCLRVDPLPRKKNGSRSSRSPSPPTAKGRSKEPDAEKVCPTQQEPLEKSSSKQQPTASSGYLNKGNEAEQSKSNVKTVKVRDVVTGKEKHDLDMGQMPNIVHSSKDVFMSQSKDTASDVKDKDVGKANEGKKALVESQLAGAGSGMGDNKGATNVATEDINKRTNAQRKKLSEHEAAVIIQSAYRGFEVRKSQPLKKLRQVAEVGKLVSEVKSRIQDLESSSSINDKEKVIIGETIMGLLLKLDTIQGLHPLVRDIRKSVANDLVGLQEKLDTLTTRESETPSEEALSPKVVVALPVNSEDAHVHETTDQAHVQHDDCEDIHWDSLMADASLGHEAVERSMPLFSDTEMSVHGENEVKESLDKGVVPAYDFNLVPHEEVKTQQSKEELDLGQLPTSREAGQQFVGATAEDNAFSVVEAEKNVDMASEVMEMPREMLAENLDAHEEKQIDVSMEEGAIKEEVSGPQDIPLGSKDSESESIHVEAVGDVHAAEEFKAESHFEVEAPSEGNDVKMDDKEKYENSVEEVMLQPQEIWVQPQESEVVHVEPAEELLPESCKAEDEVTAEGFDFKDEHTEEANVPPVQELPTVETKEYQETLKVNDDEKQELASDKPKEVLMKEEISSELDQTEFSPSSHAEGELAADFDRKLMKENERLKEMMENLIKEGNQQLVTISKLSGRVKDLEKKLSKKKKIKMRRCKTHASELQDQLRTCRV